MKLPTSYSFCSSEHSFLPTIMNCWFLWANVSGSSVTVTCWHGNDRKRIMTALVTGRKREAGRHTDKQEQPQTMNNCYIYQWRGPHTETLMHTLHDWAWDPVCAFVCVCVRENLKTWFMSEKRSHCFFFCPRKHKRPHCFTHSADSPLWPLFIT